MSIEIELVHYQEIRKKAMMEGILACLEQIFDDFREGIDSLEALRKRLDAYWDQVTSSLAECIHQEAKIAGYGTCLFDKPKEEKVTEVAKT